MKIKWIEDKSENYRGNHNSFCFKVNNSNHIFTYSSYMTYKSFKFLTRKFAQRFNSTLVEVFLDSGRSTMIVLTWEDNFKFRIELPVAEGEKRKFEYFTEDQIFKA